MRLRKYTDINIFERKFHELCIEREETESIYDGFAKLCMQLSLGNNASHDDEPNLRGWVYSRLHTPRTKWVFQNLFRQYRSILAGNIDVVVWGCGCAIDLIALFEESKVRELPQFWTNVRSVTLIDSDPMMLSRARSVSLVLFPYAAERVRTELWDWNDAAALERIANTIDEQTSSPFVPRLHIVSRAIVECESVDVFAEHFKRLVVRRHNDGRVFYNEIFCAYAPDRNRRRVEERMEILRVHWGELSVTPSMSGIPNQRLGTYFTFHCITYYNTYLHYALRLDNPIFRCMESIDLDFQSQMKLVRLASKLFQESIGGAWIYERYKYIRLIELGNTDVRGVLGKKVKCLLIAPDEGAEYKSIVIKLGAYDGDNNRYERQNIARSWLYEISKVTKTDDLRQLQSDFQRLRQGLIAAPLYRRLWSYVIVLAWDRDTLTWSAPPGQDGQYVETLNCPHEFDQLCLWGYGGRGTNEVLPTALNNMQRKIVYSRKRQRIVKGGPGTGKTLTMLHHALEVYKRTHLPVLILSHTNSLKGNNGRRLKNTFKAEFPEMADDVRVLFPNYSIAEVLCDLARRFSRAISYGLNCDRSICKLCLTSDRDGKFRPPMCQDCSNEEQARVARRQITEDRDGFPLDSHVAYMKVLSSTCDRCQARVRDMILSGEIQIDDWDDDRLNPYYGVILCRCFGGVMVDEGQLINPDDLKLIFRLTEHFNPYREFYIFADEEQSIRGGDLERDKNGRLVLKRPGELFGKPVTLKGNHRVKSRLLLRVYKEMQRMMASRYDIAELGMEYPDGGDIDDGTPLMTESMKRVFRMEKVNGYLDFASLQNAVAEMKQWARVSSVAVVADSAQLVRDFSEDAARDGWTITHLSAVRSEKDRLFEKERRIIFEEQEYTVLLTTIDCAQGRTFENVLFILTSEADNMEEAFTGATRASSHLMVMDMSESHWMYNMFNPSSRS